MDRIELTTSWDRHPWPSEQRRRLREPRPRVVAAVSPNTRRRRLREPRAHGPLLGSTRKVAVGVSQHARWPAVSHNAQGRRPRVGTCFSAVVRLILFILSIPVDSYSIEQNILDEGLQLDLHMIEAGHILLELADEVRHPCFIQSACVRHLFFQSRLAHLGGGYYRGLCAR